MGRDEDSLSLGATYHGNSLQGYDGPYGLEIQNPNWYNSGGACNLRFLHEYQHLCYRSSTGLPVSHRRLLGWPNELFSTAAEYLVGVDPDSSYFWQPQNDLPCDQSLFGEWGAYSDSDDRNAYAMWRLFAVYLMQQFNEDESEHEDDLLYQWVRTVSPADTTARGLYQLGEVLADESRPWHSKLAPDDNSRMGKLCALFQDWSIAKAIDDTTRMAPADSVTLGFGRGFSPYEDVGLFRDIDPGAPNSGVLPNEHTLGSECLNQVTWVTHYRHPSDLLFQPPPAPDTLVKLRTWSADYILFTPTSYFESGGQSPYDLKVIVRGTSGNKLPFPGQGHRLQASIVTYSSVDNVFQSGEDVIDVKKFEAPVDSGKVNITVPGFGGSVKAALVILGRTGRDPLPGGDHGTYNVWNYKYAYWVAPRFTSGSIPNDLVWADSVHVNGDAVVEDGVTLTVEAGTYVGIPEGCSLHVSGTLAANGGLVDPVKFVLAEESPHPGDWDGIYCEGTVEMSCCSLRYPVAAITAADSTSVSLEQCWFGDYLEYGIDASGSGITLDALNTTLQSTGAKSGIRVLGDGVVSLDGCTIAGYEDYGLEFS